MGVALEAYGQPSFDLGTEPVDPTFFDQVFQARVLAVLAVAEVAIGF